MRSVAWLQRGCGTLGFTLAQKSYSSGPSVFQNVAGWSAVNSMRAIDLALLKPYFHGTTNRTGAPCCFRRGWPCIPVARKVNSLVASARVATPGNGWHAVSLAKVYRYNRLALLPRPNPKKATSRGMPEFIDVDPGELHLPPSRAQGADPYKLARQMAKHGDSLDGMPLLQ